MTRLAVFAAFASIPTLVAGEPPRSVPTAKPDEPLAKTFSLDRGVELLDGITRAMCTRDGAQENGQQIGREDL